MVTWTSERQYKYRFPNLKNVKEDEWIYIDEEMQSREALGKASLPCLHSHKLPEGRVRRRVAQVRAMKSRATKPALSRESASLKMTVGRRYLTRLTQIRRNQRSTSTRREDHSPNTLAGTGLSRLLALPYDSHVRRIWCGETGR